MQLTSLPRKIARGLPYLGKEMRAIVSDHTPLFIARPRTVHIWRGSPCNAKCIMCDYGFLKGDALRALYKSELTDEMITRLIPEIAELCGRGTLVSYMGGEPTLCKSLVDWVRTASSLGLDFRFTTNGYTMNEELAGKLVDAGLFNIGISLESIDPAINEVMRPYPDGTAKTVNAIETLLRQRHEKGKHISINVKTVISELNMDSFLEIARRWGKLDGVMVTPQMFEPMEGMPGETKQKLYIKDIDRLERWTDEVRKLKAEGYNVHATDQALREMVKLYRDDVNQTSTMHGKKLTMDPSEPKCNIGTDNLWLHQQHVKLCPVHAPIGNVATDKLTLKQMWDSEMAKKVRNQTRACRRLCTISCLRRTPLKHKVSTFMKLA
jgi:sulfatase maturation enzyme AslB (radical SAM superfamily)